MALNEDQPEEIEDLLCPDYEGMKRFEPIINKFKDIFLDGHDIDPECAPKAARGRGTAARGGGSTRGAGRGSAKSS